MVKREKSVGYEVKGSGELVEISEKGFVFRDAKTGDSTITFSEIAQLIGKEVTFGIKIVEKELV